VRFGRQKALKVKKRPADVIGTDVMVGRIATGEIEDTEGPKKSPGGDSRQARRDRKPEGQIAKKAARARWSKKGGTRPYDPDDLAW
jgi:hypothetical protein